jgi:hypothetical protein
MDKDLLGEDEDLLKDLPEPSLTERAVRGTAQTLLPFAEPTKVRQFARQAVAEPESLFELPIPEMARGVRLAGERVGAAAGQLIPSKREAATKRAQEIEQELSESGVKRGAATVTDILGIGKLMGPLSKVLQAPTAGGRIAKAGGAGAAITAATTPVLEGEEDFLGQKLKQASIGAAFGALPQGAIEGAKKYLFPGSRYQVNPETGRLIDEAMKRGYTIPISEMTENAAIRTLDRLFDSPLVERNAPLFAKRVNQIIGVSDDTIGPASMAKADSMLSNTIKGLTQNQTVDLSKLSQAAQNLVDRTLKGIPDVEPGRLQSILQSLQKSVQGGRTTIDGTVWHDTRQLLNREYMRLLNSNSPDAQTMRGLINEWDNAAFNSAGNPTWKDRFIDWKSKYTAFADVSEAVNKNETARQNFLRGILDPTDLMNTIAQKRPGEFVRRTYAPPSGAQGGAGGRPQTTEAAVAGGLNIFGRAEGPTAVAPYYRAPTSARVLGTLAGAKGLQSGLYTPAGQRLILEGMTPAQMEALYGSTAPFAIDLARSLAK